MEHRRSRDERDHRIRKESTRFEPYGPSNTSYQKIKTKLMINVKMTIVVKIMSNLKLVMLCYVIMSFNVQMSKIKND